MTQHDLDPRATMQPIELTTLRSTLQAALGQYGNDAQLRRALIHAECVVADRLGLRRQIGRRNERRRPG